VLVCVRERAGFPSQKNLEMAKIATVKFKKGHMLKNEIRLNKGQLFYNKLFKKLVSK
jgi:hypothetical protein